MKLKKTLQLITLSAGLGFMFSALAGVVCPTTLTAWVQDNLSNLAVSKTKDGKEYYALTNVKLSNGKAAYLILADKADGAETSVVNPATNRVKSLTSIEQIGSFKETDHGCLTQGAYILSGTSIKQFFLYGFIDNPLT